MDLESAHRRDRILRAFFVGNDWNTNPEFALKRDLVLRSAELLSEYPLLVDDEWEVVPGHTGSGRGDLLFTDGNGSFAVVEVKFIDVGRTGATARAKRTDSRGAVRDQAVSYARAVAWRHRPALPVLAAYHTNERPDEVVWVSWALAVQDPNGAGESLVETRHLALDAWHPGQPAPVTAVESDLPPVGGALDEPLPVDGSS